MITNYQVWMYGEELASWPCDMNIDTGEVESNGAREWLFRLPDGYFLVQTDPTETRLRNPDASATRAPQHIRTAHTTAATK